MYCRYSDVPFIFTLVFGNRLHCREDVHIFRYVPIIYVEPFSIYLMQLYSFFSKNCEGAGEGWMKDAGKRKECKGRLDYSLRNRRTQKWAFSIAYFMKSE